MSNRTRGPFLKFARRAAARANIKRARPASRLGSALGGPPRSLRVDDRDERAKRFRRREPVPRNRPARDPRVRRESAIGSLVRRDHPVVSAPPHRSAILGPPFTNPKLSAR